VTKILADKSYRGDLGRDIEVVYGVVMEISERVSSGTFEVEPMRWVVERTWAWLDNAGASPETMNDYLKIMWEWFMW